MAARAYSTAVIKTNPNFSIMLGIINGRNRTGSDPIMRNAICQAIAIEKKP